MSSRINYVQRLGNRIVVGRKVVISPDEVVTLVDAIGKISHHLTGHFGGDNQ